MKVTFHLPLEDASKAEEFQSPQAVTKMVQALDRAGADACWVTDHPAPGAKWLGEGGHHTLDPFIALSFAAAASSRLMLHTQIIVLAYRNPFLTAKMAATLDVLSRGRLILGVGAGYLQPEFAALGVDFATRGALMDEAIVAMKQAWSGEAVVYKGRNFDADHVVSLPKPIQTPNPPIWVGGNSTRAIRRAVELGDGWAPFPARRSLSAATGTDEMPDIAALKAKIQVLRSLSADAGRTKPLDICMPPFNSTIHHAKRPSLPELRDQLEELKEAGVTWVALSAPCPSRAAYIDNVAQYGEEVIAPLKRKYSRQELDGPAA